jgi:hypothetical protein
MEKVELRIGVCFCDTSTVMKLARVTAFRAFLRNWPTAWTAYLLLVLFAIAGPTFGETAAFDLVGPRVEVRVQRGEKSLPIDKVPNLKWVTGMDSSGSPRQPVGSSCATILPPLIPLSYRSSPLRAESESSAQ